MAGISKYTQHERTSWVKLWLNSGQSRKSFAQAQGINYNNFKQWALTHQKSQALPMPVSKQQQADTPPSTSAFVAIKIDSSAPSSLSSLPLMEIIFANGSHLNIYQQLPAAYLRELLG